MKGMIISMKINKELLYLSREQVKSIGISMEECMDTLTQVYKAKSKGEVEMSHSTILGYPARGKGKFLRAYLAGILKQEEYGMKWLGGNKENAAIGLPPITGLIIINDPKTLSPIAVMDCTYITGIRTAAVSGIGMRTFARKDTSTMTVLGCGLQGRTHLNAAVLTLPNLKTVYAYGPRIETAQRFKVEMEKQFPNLDIIVTENAKMAIKKSMLVTSSTPFGNPELFEFIDSDYISPGTTMISISGLNHLLYDGYKSFNKSYVDDYATMESDRIKKRPHFENCGSMINGELGDVLTGKIEGRKSEEDKIILATEGLAINDIPIAHLVYRLALEKRIGTILEL